MKEVAVAEEIPVLQPEKPRGDEFLEQLRALAPDLSVVVAYGHILPKSVIDLPRLGTLNIHASLLPALRGAAPIQAAIREGLGETGVTIMQMVPALDAGPILHQARTHDPRGRDRGRARAATERARCRRADRGARADRARHGRRRSRRTTRAATYAAKLTRESGFVDWTASAHEVGRHIRAYDPKPGAWGRVRGGEVKLFGARVAPRGSSHGAGEVLAIDEAGMLVACGGGALRITVVQPAGKRRLSPREWANGRGIAVGDRFDTAAPASP